jgi:beta-glucosidase
MNLTTYSELSYVEERVDALLQKMTLLEKVSLLSGKDKWHTVPIERLGIPSMIMTDGPYGVRANQVRQIFRLTWLN